MAHQSKNTSWLFFKSLITKDNPFNSTSDALKWLKERNEITVVDIAPTLFSNLNQWVFDNNAGNLRHDSGSFFSIDGIRVKTNYGAVPQWEQPIINQPEIGILGIITKEINGILYFLMQAKIEPGNINAVQLSPTLQATKSNYTQVHKGNKPLYLEYFLNPHKEVLLDQLQSEQGSRFLRKRNRNIIIRVLEDIQVHDDFCWLTLAQIIELIQYPNTVNMDTRTVISGIPITSQGENGTHLLFDLSKTDSLQVDFLKSAQTQDGWQNFDDILYWLTQLKSKYELTVEKINISGINDWIISDESIHHKENKYFEVIPVSVTISNREVKNWSQPLLKPAQEGICGFVVKKINGILHFLVQAKLECGNLDIVEMAPTVQCLTGNYRNAVEKPLFLDYILNCASKQVIYDVYQSEEGGRFYREQNRNMIILADDTFDVQVPEGFTWLTLHQLKTFIKFNNFLNIQARSLLSAIQYN